MAPEPVTLREAMKFAEAQRVTIMSAYRVLETLRAAQEDFEKIMTHKAQTPWEA